MAKSSFKIKFLALLFGTLVFSACVEDDEPVINRGDKNNSEVNNSIYRLMKDWYYWNDRVPEVDPSRYDNPEDLLKALTHKPVDQWSFIMDTISFKKYFEEGEMLGYGMGMQLDANNDVRITFVFDQSPMGRQNVTRGWKILKINGKDVKGLIANNTFNQELGENRAGVQTSFQMEDLNGNVKSFTLAKQAINVNTVLHKSVLTSQSNKKVGYLVFESFIATSNAELDEAFNHFKEEGISELVLDLRYNGGGSLEVASHLASLINGSGVANKEFVELSYNANHQNDNKQYNFSASPNGLRLDRLFVLTTQSSASASEVLISGLEPYMPVYTIGDKTHGKPVGMNVFSVGKYAVAPITFKVVNSLGQGDYFNGIEADAYVIDNLNYDFGDRREDCLKQALYFIDNGSFEGITARKSIPAPEQRIKLEGFRAQVGAF